MHRQYIQCLNNTNNVYMILSIFGKFKDCVVSIFHVLLIDSEMRGALHYQAKSVDVGLRGEGSVS